MPAKNNAAKRAAYLEKKRVASAKWYAANREKGRAASRAWEAANREKKNAIARAWYAANREKVSAASAKRHAANPHKSCAKAARRRATLRAQSPLLTTEEQARVIGFYAQARAMSELTGEPYHVDHKVAIARGGLHHPDNLQVMRGVDNLKKGTR